MGVRVDAEIHADHCEQQRAQSFDFSSSSVQDARDPCLTGDSLRRATVAWQSQAITLASDAGLKLPAHAQDPSQNREHLIAHDVDGDVGSQLALQLQAVLQSIIDDAKTKSPGSSLKTASVGTDPGFLLDNDVSSGSPRSLPGRLEREDSEDPCPWSPHSNTITESPGSASLGITDQIEAEVQLGKCATLRWLNGED